MINEYNPESGVPLAAFINTQLANRAIEASRRVLGEEFTEDVTEARGVIAEETDVEVTEEVRGPRKPTETTIFSDTVLANLGVDTKEQAEKQISDATNQAFEGQDITRFGQTKNVPVAVAEIYGKMFGVNPETIYDKKRNYSKKDAEGLTRIKQYLIDNAASDFARLPKTKDDFGKATFIPNNVMNALYTDGELTGTIKNYLDLIREKPVKPIYRDRVGQTIRGLFNTSIRNRMVEDLIPSKPERVRAGVKFSKKGETVQGYYRAKPGDIAKTVGVKLPARIQIQKQDPKTKEIKLKPYTVRDLDGNFSDTETIRQARDRVANNFINKSPEFRDLLRTTMSGGVTISMYQTTVEFDKSVGSRNVNQEASPRFVYNIKKFLKSNILDLIKKPNFKEEQNKKLPLLKKFGLSIQDYLQENQQDVWFFEEMILDTSNNQNSIVRILAPFNFYPVDLNGKPITNQLVVEEHTDPQIQIGRALVGAALENRVEEVWPVIEKSYMQGSLLETDDNLLRDAGLASDMPGIYFEKILPRLENGELNLPNGLASVSRLAVAGIDLNKYYLINENQTIAEYFNVENLPLEKANKLVLDFLSGEITKKQLEDINFENKKLKNTILKASKSNNNKLPKTVRIEDPSTFDSFGMVDIVAKQMFPDATNVDAVKAGKLTPYEALDADQKFEVMAKVPNTPVVKFSKQNNNRVLNRMEELDNEAAEANKDFYSNFDLDKDFNKILEQTTGIASEKEYKKVKAQVAGASRGIVFRGIPYSAQDFVGLLYETLGKGKLGDAQMAWYKQNLIKPFAKAMNEIDNSRLAMLQDYRDLKKELGVVPKDLRKKIPGEPFTREQAVRVYIWNMQGMNIPGISQSDLKDLTEYVQANKDLNVFADQIMAIQKGDEYAKPKEGWPAGSITTDLLQNINTVKRAKYLEQWKNNVDIIFSEKNMNKLEAAFGKKYRVALKNMLQRMETGRNRTFSDDSLTGRFTDWLQGSIGTIMFFNTRSAILQTISAVNFINFTDNNPLAAGKAFANQKQYWSDFMTLINSDFLKARRSGLRFNVSEADIADMAKQGGPRAVINRLLQLGFTPTQIADSFAIASGGATFYRNRIKSLMKQGISKQEAETQAFEDFRENAEESQQSSRPDRISMQQAGPLGRLILAFANTPAQYARLTGKAIRDLKNNRGDAKTNISKIIYYTTVQNLIFNALQQAIFAMAFDEEEPDEKEKKDKYISIANGMADSLLRGAGFAGAAVSVGKNSILRIIKESEKDRPKFEKIGYELTKISPPISAKLSRINQAARSYQWEKDEMLEKGWSLDNPAYLAAANVISATTNIPIDRGIKKANNIVRSTDSDLELWERLALFGGWQDWEIGLDEETKTNKPQPRKVIKRKAIKRKTTTR